MAFRLSIVLFLLTGVVAAPFAFQPEGAKRKLHGAPGDRLVIITPHNQSIQTEFGRAFTRHMANTYDREVFVDWRQPGGTTEIARFLRSEYSSRFESLWAKVTGLPFTYSIRDAFTDSKLDPATATQDGLVSVSIDLPPGTPPEQHATARQLFLESGIGVGIDLFFGGGAYDFERQAASGFLVARDASGRFGPGALAEARPEWFSEAIMPASVGGEPFRDADFRWVGTVLSAFGICYNADVLTRLGIDEAPQAWTALEDPRLFGQIALADPTKSGSTTKAFEMLIQERIQTVQRSQIVPETVAVAAGWDEAMRLILRISANSRYFTDSAAKVPRDVAMGDAAVGMCIDFYGRTFNELFRSSDGDSRVHFVMPRGGTSIGADPIGMLRGAPQPELAHRFIEFVLSPEGQKLWNYRPGTNGGPVRFALRRPPIRKDFYVAENEAAMTDPGVNPYELTAGFTYHPEWTGSLFSALRFVIRGSCMDPHEEQIAAWETLIAAGLPAEGVARFENIAPIAYERVVAEIAPGLRSADKVAQVRMARELAETYRAHYRDIAKTYGGTR